MTCEYNAANDAWERGHAYPNDAPGLSDDDRQYIRNIGRQYFGDRDKRECAQLTSEIDALARDPQYADVADQLGSLADFVREVYGQPTQQERANEPRSRAGGAAQRGMRPPLRHPGIGQRHDHRALQGGMLPRRGPRNARASPGRPGTPAGCPERGCGRTREPCDACQQGETEDLIRGLRDKEMAE